MWILFSFAQSPGKSLTKRLLPRVDPRFQQKVWIVFWAAAASSQNLAVENAARYKDWQDLIARLLTECGTSSQHLDGRLYELMSIIDGLGVRLTLTPSPKNRELARKTIADWVGRLDLPEDNN
ncbi:MAG TPA: hypothetical protein EYQ14_12955 [Gammaproteobacteria bacterium]|nr:hypothetical protein [Gammaproteobacteria bacterium]